MSLDRNIEDNEKKQIKELYIEFKQSLKSSKYFQLTFSLPVVLLCYTLFPEQGLVATAIGFILFGFGLIRSIYPEPSDFLWCIPIFIGVLFLCYAFAPNLDQSRVDFWIRRWILWPFSVGLLVVWNLIFFKWLTGIILNRLNAIPFREFLERNLIPLVNKQSEGIRRLEQAQVQRLDKLIKAHALYTELGHFEGILEIVGKRSSLAKFAMARMISEALNKVFLNSTYFKINSQEYHDFAEVFQNCLVSCQSVRLTCIYSPENWFEILNTHKPYSKDWINIDIPELDLSNLNPDSLKKLTDTPGQDYRYPRHYVSFLSVNDPIRIFLLGKTEWENLKRNKDAFEKFMRPCDMEKVYTLFVKIEDFVQSIFSGENKISTNPFLKIQKNSLDKLDLNLFEREACMEWDGNNIKFIFPGDQLDSYNLLLDYIISEKGSDSDHAKSIGIYTSDEVRGEVLI